MPPHQNDDARYLHRSAVSMGIVAILAYAADYAFNLTLTRQLTTHDYGDIKVAHAFALFWGHAVLLGGDRAAPMVLAPAIARGEPLLAGAYLRFYLAVATAMSLLIASVTWTGAYLHVGVADPESHHPLAWVVVVIPLTAVGALASRSLQSARRPATAALPWRIGLPLLQIALLAAAVRTVGPLGVQNAIVISIIAVAAITLGQGLILHRLRLVDLAGRQPFSHTRSWLVASLPMMGSFLVALALAQSDLYFLEILGDEVEVGHYAAAATAAHVLILVQTTVVGLVAPLARPAIDAGTAASHAAYRRGQTLMLVLLVSVAVPLVAAGGAILELFGAAYRTAQPVLVLLAVGNFAWATAALASLWLQYRGRSASVLAISIGTLLVDSVLNVLLIPRYGMEGAAWGTATTLMLAAGTLLILARQR